MNRSPEQLMFPTERLREELLVKATELRRLHDSGLISESGTTWFRPDPQLKAEIARTLQEGAKILGELEPLLGDAGKNQLALLLLNNPWVQKFNEENKKQ